MPDSAGPQHRWTDASAPYLAPRTPGSGDAWSAEAAAQGRKGAQRILDAGKRLAPPEVAAWFGIRPHLDAAVFRRRLVLMDDEPVEIADSWYPLIIADSTPLAEVKRIPGGTVSFLADRGFVAHRVEEIVSAPHAGRECEDLLVLLPGERVLRLIRLSRTADGELFEVAVMAMKPELPDGELRQLRYELTLD